MIYRLSFALLLTTSMVQNALAVEGGIGRPITGMQVQPYNAILPTENGGVLTLSSIYYDGGISKSKEVPIIGQLSAGLDYKVSYNLLNGIFVWNSTDKWSVATTVGIPVQYTDIRGSINNLDAEQSTTKIGDAVFSPVSFNYHFSPVMHGLFGVSIYAPTGSYDKNIVSNAGQNTWTFVPNVAFTKIFPTGNAEISTNIAYEIYTKNDATDYENGDLFRMDILGLKRFGDVGSDGLGAGAVFGWIQQTTDDKSNLGDRFDGFKGKALGIGPILTYEKKLSDTAALSASFRGVYEFDVKNRPEGEAYQLTVNYQF